MHKIDQHSHWHSTHLKQTHLHTFRHNADDMSCITGVILDAFEYNKIFVHLAFHLVLPVSVSFIRIMVGDQHSVKSVCFQFCNIFVQTHSAVNRTFLHMTMHIQLHKQASFAWTWFYYITYHAKYNWSGLLPVFPSKRFFWFFRSCHTTAENKTCTPDQKIQIVRQLNCCETK